MGSAKNIYVKPITPKRANVFVIKHHYSGKIVQNSRVHFGVFLNGVLGGVLQYGSCTDKKKTIRLVKNTRWNDFIELNRMVFTDLLPRNSESRAISITIRLLKNNAPNLKWIISFADATSCGDGTIYRASGFKLVGINKNKTIRLNPETGTPMHAIQAHHKKIGYKFRSWTLIEGYMLKYVYLIDKKCVLNKPLIPFDKIKEIGADMYKGGKAVLV